MGLTNLVGGLTLHIKLEGKEISLSYEDAKEVWEQLEKIFDPGPDPVKTFHPPLPTIDPWNPGPFYPPPCYPPLEINKWTVGDVIRKDTIC